MTSIAQKLSEIVGSAFEALELPRDLGIVRVSDRPDLAQFQCNGAMAAAKLAKKNPREIAQAIVEYLLERHSDEGRNLAAGQEKDPVLQRDDALIFSNIEIAGPGFINLNVTDEFLQNYLNTLQNFGVENIGNNQKVILDYGGMNVAKAMHVGHLRANVIGDCMRGLLRFVGYDALGDVHLGDWGLQMGQIISEFEIRYPEWPYFDNNFEGEYPKDAPFEYSELETIYPEASQACKEDEARLEIARKATAELQSGRKGYGVLLQHFIDLSIVDIKDNLAPLNIDYDIWNGEACVAHLVPEITEDLAARNITQTSDGAIVIPVAREGDKHEIPPLIFLKSNGAMTYGTTDIATIYDRKKTHGDIARMIYVVDKRQSLHFEQVFRACEQAGYSDAINIHHIGFGTVNGTDGKPFKTREGKAMTFRGMVQTTIEKARDRIAEASLAENLDDTARADIAQKVAVSALKFTELSNQTHMDYIFDIDRMTSFEGKTGPYLLYQTVRIKSLIDKAVAQGIDFENAALSLQEEDRALALLMSEFSDALNLSIQNYAPHHLCEYVYKLAQAFSSFYGNVHILSEEDKALRASRLLLCQKVAEQLEQGLELLGISIPDKM